MLQTSPIPIDFIIVVHIIILYFPDISIFFSSANTSNNLNAGVKLLAPKKYASSGKRKKMLLTSMIPKKQV